MRLANKRVMVTQSDDYMGPAITSLFLTEGARVTTREKPVPTGKAFSTWVREMPLYDVVVANLAHDPCSSAVDNIDNEDWQALFEKLVHPRMYIVRHFAPKMAEHGYGKIIAITSAAPPRGIPGSTAYCAARGAQNAFIRATGLEFAARGVNINAVAQNYASNPAYFPDDLVASDFIVGQVVPFSGSWATHT